MNQQSAEIRRALAGLPRAPQHLPGAPVELADVYTPAGHRGALDPERALVVGNRGMGKSLWTHALLNPEIRARIAEEYHLPTLRLTEVRLGFNGSEGLDPVAPTPAMLARHEPVVAWRAVLARALVSFTSAPLPTGFDGAVAWVKDQPEAYAALLTGADQALAAQGRRLLLVFDALDRLGEGRAERSHALQGLLRLALATQSLRRVRAKLFVRPDQFEEPTLFGFPDASKLRSAAVTLVWSPNDLYHLLFHTLRGCAAFVALRDETFARSGHDIKALIDALAGEHMGATKKHGRVFTWLPTHLADAFGQISPRTFLTTWRVAAEHDSPRTTPVDHLGLSEGVRRASEDRLIELAEDYPWVRAALAPLRDQEVPLTRGALVSLWREDQTFEKILRQEGVTTWDPRILGPRSEEDAVLDALKAIGVAEVRGNGKINVPDIFRVEARIKRRGGVKPPGRPGA